MMSTIFSPKDISFIFLDCGLVAFDTVFCCILTPTFRSNLLISSPWSRIRFNTRMLMKPLGEVSFDFYLFIYFLLNTKAIENIVNP